MARQWVCPTAEIRALAPPGSWSIRRRDYELAIRGEVACCGRIVPLSGTLGIRFLQVLLACLIRKGAKALRRSVLPVTAVDHPKETEPFGR